VGWERSAPQSPQNCLLGRFSAPHLAQRLPSGDPQSLQNRLLSGFSEPQQVQRIGLPGKPNDWPFLVSPGAGKGQRAEKHDRNTSHCRCKAVGDRAEGLRGLIEKLQADGVQTLRTLAEELNRRRIPPPQGYHRQTGSVQGFVRLLRPDRDSPRSSKRFLPTADA
jgi:hypothetical protein